MKVLGETGEIVDLTLLPPREPAFPEGWVTAWCRQCNTMRWTFDLVEADEATYWRYLSRRVCPRHWEPYLIFLDDRIIDDQQTFV